MSVVPESVPDVSLSGIMSRIERLPALPRLVQEVLAGFAASGIKLADLANKISRDPGLAGNVLRLANSPFYGLSREVSTVQNAALVLGLGGLRQIVVAAGVGESLQKLSPAFDHEQFWQHSLQVAAIAQALAGVLGEHQDIAFTAGLVHDIGRPMLASCLPDEYKHLYGEPGTEMELLEREQQMLGFDHAACGTTLAAHWQFPPGICVAIARHHTVAEAEDRLSIVIALAELAAQHSTFMNPIWNDVPEAVFARLGVSMQTLLAAWPAGFDEAD